MQPGERIFYYDGSKNWWNRGKTGPATTPVGDPCGPDSEMFYDFGPSTSSGQARHDKKFGEHCHPNCDCGRFVELGNNVFMTYRKESEGKFVPLASRNIDHGSGLERIAAASENNPDVFTIDIFNRIIAKIEQLSGTTYQPDQEWYRIENSDNRVYSLHQSFRIVADHMRAAIFLITQGILPSNIGRGYVVRRLLRRAIRHTDLMGFTPTTLAEIVDVVAESYRESYPDVLEHQDETKKSILEEENKFRSTLAKGVSELKKMLLEQERITGEDLFFVFSTYGFPLELSFEELENFSNIFEAGASLTLQSYNRQVLQEEFEKEFKKHQDISRTTSAGVFKGGLADHSDKVIRYHTATHLLHQALRTILGNHVIQKGSNITTERTRFDFIHNEKMTDEQKKQVEDLVNAWIKADYPVKKEIMPLAQARELGAIGAFGEKYSDTVSVYTVYNDDKVISREFCGGPHVEHTGSIGEFKITKEEAVSAGVRRIRAMITS